MSMILVVLPYFTEKGTESPMARKYGIGGKAYFLNYDIFFFQHLQENISNTLIWDRSIKISIVSKWYNKNKLLTLRKPHNTENLHLLFIFSFTDIYYVLGTVVETKFSKMDKKQTNKKTHVQVNWLHLSISWNNQCCHPSPRTEWDEANFPLTACKRTALTHWKKNYNVW